MIMADVKKKLPNGQFKLMPDYIDIHDPKDDGKATDQAPFVTSQSGGSGAQSNAMGTGAI